MPVRRRARSPEASFSSSERAFLSSLPSSTREEEEKASLITPFSGTHTAPRLRESGQFAHQVEAPREIRTEAILLQTNKVSSIFSLCLSDNSFVRVRSAVYIEHRGTSFQAIVCDHRKEELPEFINIFGSGDYRAVHLGRSSSTACIHIQGYTLSVIGRFPSISVLYNTHQFQPQSRLAFTNCFPSRPSIGAPALTYSSIISPKLFKPSRIIPQDG